MIVGLVTSILPGLEEKDEAIQKKIIEILGKLQICVGERFLIGALWIAILRTPKVRVMAIQYLMRIGKKRHLPSKEGLDSSEQDTTVTPPISTDTTVPDASQNGVLTTSTLIKNRDSGSVEVQMSDGAKRFAEVCVSIPRPDCKL